MEIELNGEKIRDEFIYGMITNSESVGGFRSITGKNIRLDDGLFEVTMIKTPRNAIELQEIITSLLRGEMDSNYIISYKTRQVMAAIIKKLKSAVIRKQWISLSIISLARVKSSTQEKNRGYLTKKVFSFWCN